MFPPARYRKRRVERSADELIRWLRSSGEWDVRQGLAGSQLRAQARAVDLAEYAATAEPGPYAAQCYAMTSRELRETLIAYGLAPQGTAADDPISQLLADLDASADAATHHRPPG